MNKKNKKQLKVCLTTLGCKVNQFESESIYAELHKSSSQNSIEIDSDVCIINTCTVTQKASMQSRQAIRKAIRDNPNAIILATGCYAQSEPLELKKIKGLDYIIGNSDKHRIAQIFNSSDNPKKNSAPVIVHRDIRNEKCMNGITTPLIGNRTRPFIKVQDGCDNFCSYCIVPYTRGPSRSLPSDEVISTISALPALKTKEIVLTGIHLGRYGRDLSPPTTLLNLLIRIQKAEIVSRIRLSSLEPGELTDDLLKFTANSGIICRHFHIPLQSGDKTILKKMNRPYDPALFERLIKQIHRTIPDAAIGVDVMVGFPGETDEAFRNTFSLLKSLPITYLHVFPFSSRPGTKASNYPNQVDPQTIKKRRNQILELGHGKKTAFYTQRVGQTLDVLIEGKRESASGQLTGVSSNYVRVLIDGDDSLKNRIIPCCIKKVLSKNAVLGEYMT
ncbi:MAG: tRNA (N(6)-L-threonylcarbamoyladenosine(37)-C(2))-methylthiotransferase MtaB [Desulfobacteraceae bacterium]|nr:tRNA (N(6)-L-threonylcarbamoyladenosine(37)-C(2))-methylthiotransferase MtaB [Desulfobacteraceae bacterium]MBC2757097.1 tRNA (N(6)-L-threonylcarbamoyladenosine(37)-C(2))-methylthiotransferase MtaB [Desulfobacteraceae bacterium]MBC2763687.1 tRNA (N(6)-L-threonylcarbamoyladenosine(37)-C(2))-methylthiotransferase MtaB [ANME-2 cluster archaeon]